MINLGPYFIHEPVVPYQYHIKGTLQLISNQKILQQICVHCYLLWKTFYSGAISSIPSPHQCPPGFISHCPLNSLCVELSIWAFYGVLFQIASARGWGQLHTMLTTAGSLFVDHHARIGTLAQLHTNHTGRQRPSWVTKRQLSWGAVLSLRIIITPLSSTFRRSLSQFVLCHRGPGGWGLGRLAPDSQSGLKIAPKIASFWGY